MSHEKRLEERVRELEEQLDQSKAEARRLKDLLEFMLRGSEASIWTFELHGDSIMQSRMVEYDFWDETRRGKSPIGMGWDTILNIIGPEQRAPLTAAIDECVRGEKEEVHFEYQASLFTEGPPRWRYMRGRTIRSPEGKPLRFVGTTADITDQKRVQEEVKRATLLLELATKLSRVYIWQFDFVGGQIDDARATFINVWESLGYDPKDAPSSFASSLGLVVLQEDQGAVMTVLQACIRGEIPTFEAEYRVRHFDGSIHWNLARGIVMRNPDGTPRSFVGTSVDVTALKDAEEAARRNREQLELSILGSNACTWDFELLDGSMMNARATYANVFEILGYTSEDDTNQFPDALAALIPPERQAEFVADVQAHLDGTGREWERELRVQYKGGAERWQLSRGVVKRDPVTGQARRFTGIGIDITERVLVEKALRESEQHFRGTFENAAVGMALTDSNGLFVDCNDTLAGLLGYSREEVIGQQWPKFMVPEEVPAGGERLRALVDGEVARHSLDRRCRRKDGSDVWTHITYSVMLRDADGQPSRILGIFQDITERKALEEDLRVTKERLELGILGASTSIFDIDMPSGTLDDSEILVLNGWELFGYDLSTAPTHFPTAAALVIHSEDVERAVREAAAYLNGHVPRYESEYRIRHAGGAVVWILARGVALRDAQGNPERFIGSLVNITGSWRSTPRRRPIRSSCSRRCEGQRETCCRSSTTSSTSRRSQRASSRLTRPTSPFVPRSETPYVLSPSALTARDSSSFATFIRTCRTPTPVMPGGSGRC
ncbi:MAG: hypothetical protein K0S65_1326 [Labilithrix sp.]|nr:hypothetical protein [Labilithrix sp.]